MTERYEFHTNKYSLVADSSFIYMLFEIQNLEINQLEPYLQSDESDQPSSMDRISEELFKDFDTTKNTNTNQINMHIGEGLTSLTGSNSLTRSFAGGDSTHIDKFRLQISLGSTVDSITDISADGFTVTYAHGDVCDAATG